MPGSSRIVFAVVSAISIMMSSASHSQDGSFLDDRAVLLSYFSQLVHKPSLPIWPTRTKVVEVVSSDEGFRELLAKYQGMRRSLFSVSEFGQISQISIIIGYDFDRVPNFISSLESSRIISNVKDVLKDQKLSIDGCSEFGFTSRGTWISSGIVVIDRSILADSDLEACFFAALDVANGFPVDESGFAYTLVPETAVRGRVMDAIAKCTYEYELSVPGSEVSRDGARAPVSLDCVKSLSTQN